jgi:ribosome-associated protein
MTEFLHGYDEDRDGGKPSKSQRKRDMTALQKLGEALIALAPEQVQRMDLPDDLSEAIRFYHSLREKEAKRRHMQFIGTIMRKLDPEPIRIALDELDQLRMQQTEDFHQVEEWRDSLLAGDHALLDELVQRFDLNRQQVRQLVKNAAVEKADGKPAKNGRQLFRLLRQSLEKEGDA